MQRADCAANNAIMAENCKCKPEEGPKNHSKLKDPNCSDGTVKARTIVIYVVGVVITPYDVAFAIFERILRYDGCETTKNSWQPQLFQSFLETYLITFL